jgi:phosphatidylinositol alpha-1,6-mannosyltransferase
MILFTTQNFPPDIGGIQIYMGGLADSLAARGHAIAVCCDADSQSGPFDAARAYPIHRFGGAKIWQRHRKARAVARRIAQGGVTTIIADSWKSLTLLPRDRPPAVRMFCIAHGAELLVAPGSAKERRMRASLAKADIVAANSHFTADLARPFLSQKAALRVLTPGVYPPSGASRVLTQRENADEPHIVTVARFDPYKGIDSVIRAVSRLRTTHPKLVYDVIGDGKDRERLHALARERGVADRVRFHGKVDDAQKSALLGAADLFVLPNRRESGEVEGFGIVFVEAGAFGLPCIAGADGGTADAVIEGETGFLVNGADDTAVEAAIARLLTDKALAARMGAAGHARFWSQFAWDAAIARFETAMGLA